MKSDGWEVCSAFTFFLGLFFYQKQLTKFTYLGYMITSDGGCTTEIGKRIAMAKDAFKK